MKEIKTSLKKFKRIMRNHDKNISILIECIAIIMIWRGIWELLDMYLFPSNPIVSNLVSITLWIIILLVDDGKLWELEVEPHKSKK